MLSSHKKRRISGVFYGCGSEIVAVAANGIEEQDEHQQVDVNGKARAFVLVVEVERAGQIKRKAAQLQGDALQAKEEDQGDDAVGAAAEALQRAIKARSGGARASRLAKPL